MNMESDPSCLTEISVVVPVYRSVATLELLVSRLEKTLVGLVRSYEIILVNDGSPDDSWAAIESLSRKNPSVAGINLMRNYGQHAALAAGIRACRGQVIVTLDDDLQTPPEEMPKLLEKLQEGFDLVYGARTKEAHGLFRNTCSRIGKNLLAKVFGVRVATSLSSYKAFQGALRQPLLRHHGPVVFLDALLCWGTTRVGSVEVEHHQRKEGSSGYNWPKLIRHYTNMTTSFSQFPLQVASFLGVVTMIAGFSLFLFVLIIYWIRGIPVPGFTFVAASITLFSGIQLFILGVIGEYLARMHQNLIGMPPYVIRQTVGALAHLSGSADEKDKA